MKAACQILVTGASGFVGQRIVERLQAGREPGTVLALSRGAMPTWPEGTRWLKADLRDGGSVAAALRSGITGHVAWIHAAPLPLIANLLPLVGNGGIVRCVAIGTTSVLTKADSPSPLERSMVHDYRAAEEALKSRCEGQQVTWTLLRPTLVYDGVQDRNVTRIAHFIRRLGFFPVAGQGKGLRQPLYADDLAAACQAALAQEGASCAYNLAGGETLSYRIMLERIFRALGRRPRILPLPLVAYRAAIRAARLHPRFRNLSPDVADRMDRDLVFDFSEAVRDLKFHPRGFAPEFRP